MAERFDWGELAGLVIGVVILLLIDVGLRIYDWWKDLHDDGD